MLRRESLKDLLNQESYGRGDKLLMCLAVDAGSPKQVRELRQIARAAGLRSSGKWNISQILKDTNGLAIRTDEGWELSADGRRRVAELAGPLGSPVVARVAAFLRQHLGSIKDEQTRSFVEEAVECLENGQLRAAVVLSWVGAVAVLHGHVVAKHLADFNKEASRRNTKWKTAKTVDDLTLMKEYDFLQLLPSVSILGKNVKQELENCLKLRNGCGHPSSLAVGEHRAAAHVESLILNVFAKF